MAQFDSIFPKVVTVWQWTGMYMHKDLQTKVKQNVLAIIIFIIYSCAFPTVTCQNVCCEKGLLIPRYST